MTEYNILNAKLYNSQFNKLKTEIKNGTEVTLNLSSNVIGNYNNEKNFPHRLSLVLVIHKFQGFVKPFQIIHQLI